MRGAAENKFSASDHPLQFASLAFISANTLSTKNDKSRAGQLCQDGEVCQHDDCSQVFANILKSVLESQYMLLNREHYMPSSGVDNSNLPHCDGEKS